MCRILDAGRWGFKQIRRPMIWLPLLVWGALAVLVLRNTTPGPDYHLNVDAAWKAHDGRSGEARGRADRLGVVLGVSAHGHVVGTKARANFGPPYRVWHIQTGTLEGEVDWVETKKLAGLPRPLAPSGNWLAIQVAQKGAESVTKETRFLRMPTGIPGPTIPTGVFCFSTTGRQVAYRDDVNRLLDLDTGTTRPLFEVPDPKMDAERAALLPITPCCFSPDDLLLAGASQGIIVVLEVASGKIVAKHPFADNARGVGQPSVIAFSADNRAVAWEFEHKINVLALDTKRHFVIPRAELIGWSPAGRLLVAHKHAGEWDKSAITSLASWDHAKQQPVRQWQVPPELFPSFGLDGNCGATKSHGGRHLLYWRAEHNKSKVDRDPLSLMLQAAAELRGEGSFFVSTYLLDIEDLVLRRQWKMEHPGNSIGVGAHACQLTPDDEYLIFSDFFKVEMWPVTPRSMWFKSVLYAGAFTLFTLLPVFAWAWWRKRRREKTSTTAPSHSPA